MKTTYTLLFAATFLFIGCGDHEHAHDDSTAHDHETTSETSTAVESKTLLQLNNGDRWPANQETTDGVIKMIQLIDNYEDTANVEGFAQLSEDLQVEYKMIFDKCTMTGAAHEQLHVFLIPMKPYFEALSAGDKEMCQKSLERLAKHMRLYDRYFQ
jgi:hypothetical protein